MSWIRHLSIRVPWHDRAWDGHICNAPLENNSCLALKIIAENRKDDFENEHANKAFGNLQPNSSTALFAGKWEFS